MTTHDNTSKNAPDVSRPDVEISDADLDAVAGGGDVDPVGALDFFNQLYVDIKNGIMDAWED